MKNLSNQPLSGLSVTLELRRRKDGKSEQVVLPVTPGVAVKTNAKLINQLDWEVTTETIGCDFYLSAVRTVGTTNDVKIFGE